MRLIKTFVLAALAVLSATALVGPSSAVANGVTAACKTSAKICPESELVSSIHLNNTEGSAIGILTSVANVLCLGVLASTKSLQVGIPQKINTESFSFTGCGTTSAHNNCTVEFTELPSFTLLKTEPNFGELTATKGKLLVKCEIGGLFKLNCIYDTKNLEFKAEGALYKAGTGHGMITATSTPLSPKEEKEGCPKESSLDLLLEPSEHVYIAEVENQSTALCKVHQDPCQSANQVETLHISTGDPTLLVPYGGKTNVVACQSSLVSASVGELAAPQVITIEEFTWTGCSIGGESCTVKTVELGTLYLYRTGLNVGSATATNDEIEVSCTKPSSTCTFAGEPKLTVEGAEHTGSAGHGMFRATESELELVSGSCEGAATLHGLFEPLIDLSLVS
jgi:hypothetical protein